MSGCLTAGTRPSPRGVTTGEAHASRRVFAVHPLFFALFPVCSLYATNLSQVPWSDFARVLGLTLLAAAILYSLVCLAIRPLRRAAVAVSTLLILFFSFGHFLTLPPDVRDELLFFFGNGAERSLNLFLLPLCTGIFAAVSVYCVRAKHDFVALTALLNVVGFTLLIQPVTEIVTSHSQDSAAGIATSKEKSASSANAAPTPGAPDIYYVILDAYGRQDVLQRFYQYDNQPFVDALKKRGFFVASHARPNYGQTVMSIASSLNFSYLDTVAKQEGAASHDYHPLHEMIDHNEVASYLKTKGYRFVSVGTGYALTATPDADVVLHTTTHSGTGQISAFEGLLLDLTPLRLLPRTNETLYDQHRDRILGAFQELNNVPRLPYRKFVFAHILAPHPPFVFGPNGEELDQHGVPYSQSDASDWLKSGNRAEYRARYIGQLQFINHQVLKTIDTILATSSVRPIIIVQGDHGPRQFVDWHSLEDTDVRETYGNLNAFSLPDNKAASVFYDSISPVNSFRLLFDHLFDAHFERLPDHSYYSTLDHPYRFTDVTDASKPTPVR